MAEICSRVSILGVKIDNVTIGEAVQRIRAWIKAGGPHLVVTCNPEMVMTAAIDQLLAEILRRADLVVPDGIGVVWASRASAAAGGREGAGHRAHGSRSGCRCAEGWRVFLLGGEPGVAARAAQAMCTAFPGLRIVGEHHGFFTRQEEPGSA